MFEDVLHGIFHFDTKAWRTIPALIFRPGYLTKDYIEGKRTSFVSPLALFLFLIFLMFFVFSFTMKGPSEEMLKIPEVRESIVKKLESSQELQKQQMAELAKLPPRSSDAVDLQQDIRETQSDIRKFQDRLDSFDGKPIDLQEAQQQLANNEKSLAELRAKEVAYESLSKAEKSASEVKPWELAQEIRHVEREIKYYKKRLEKNKPVNDETATKPKSSNSDAVSNKDGNAVTPAKNSSAKTDVSVETDNDLEDLAKIPYVGEALAHADKNRELTLYKMKKNAASSAFLLMPISLPFLWLLFAFKRKYVMFDHAVFSLYSLSFMCLLLITIAILSKFDFTGTAGFLFMTVPPVHMFAQLRRAYSLSIFGTLWRTLALLFIAFLSLLIYAALVTLLSA
jgi:F0F1-type ATP synthase membrane subunit b/b'